MYATLISLFYGINEYFETEHSKFRMTFLQQTATPCDVSSIEIEFQVGPMNEKQKSAA